MLDNDTIMTAKASEVVHKVLLMKKIITNATCALYFPYSHNIFSRNSLMLFKALLE